jgi:glycolate oxidase
MLFDFERLPDACRAVSAVIAAGIVPGAMEIMDRHTVTLVEAWLELGLPTDAGGVLLIEIDGPAVTLEDRVARVTTLAHAHGARTTRVARDEAERQAIWKGRKSAFGAYGRAASGFYIMDGVVPRTRLAEALERIERLCAAEGLDAGNVFHAGDGNLHPHVLFDASRPDRRDAALAVSHAILRMCIAMGGTISGEHGVGIEKRSMMSELFAPEDLAAMERLRDAFDPDRRLNPGKILPSGAGCGETRAAQRSFGGIPATVPATGEGPWI